MYVIFYPVVLNRIGIVLTALGVILLFRFAMPFQTRTHGNSYLLLEASPTPDALRQRRLFDIIGYVGLGAIIVGAALQFLATF
jgi:hypothetical protein